MRTLRKVQQHHKTTAEAVRHGAHCGLSVGMTGCLGHF